jgi:hypothetical protein
VLIDHLVYAVPDLADGVTDLERRLGARAAGGGRHDGLGTHNALLSLGPRTYLEVIAPDPTQPTPQAPLPFGVADATGPALVAWALGVDDIAAAAEQARQQGLDLGSIVPGRRTTAEGTLLQWQLTENAMVGGPVPFLISWGDTPHPAAAAPGGLTLETLHVEHPAPEELTRQLRAVGADVVRLAARWSLVATINGPAGTTTLR